MVTLVDLCNHRYVFQGKGHLLAKHRAAGQLGAVAAGPDDGGPDGLAAQYIVSFAKGITCGYVQLGGVVVTNDYNLNKVAAVRKVPVLNINELANALKPIALPGEEMSVFVVKEGKEAGQGIGYMDDGTMIVIENGRRLVGETGSVTVTSVLQTSAGRMIFAKVKQS